jgi:hypothetical protein
VALRVVDQIGSPVADALVLIDGALVTTDADGQATSSDVRATYDVAVVFGTHAYVFLGMTTRSPLLELRHSVAVALTSTATVELLGDFRTTPLALVAGVTGTSPDEQTGYFRPTNQGGSIGMTWRGSSAATLSVEAVVTETDESTGTFSPFGNTIGFSSYAKQTFDAVPDADLMWQPELTPVPFDTVPIHVGTDAAAPGLIEYSAEITESIGPLGVLATVGSGASADLPVLDIPGARYVISADIAVPQDDENTADTSVHAEQRDVEPGASVQLKTAPLTLNIAPGDHSIIEPDTTFSWTAGEGAVNVLYVLGNDTDAQFYYAIATQERSARIPDLSPLGKPFPAGRNLTWSVGSEFGHASIDTYAAGERSNGLASGATRFGTSAP